MDAPEPQPWSVAGVVPTLATRELELGVSFYRRLGFELEWRWPERDATHAGLRRGSASLMLAECEPAIEAVPPTAEENSDRYGADCGEFCSR